MKKVEIIEKIVSQTNLGKPTVRVTVEAILDIIQQSMLNGENIYLRGFGTFLLKKRNKRMGRDIRKDINVIIPTHFVPTFKPCKEFILKVRTNLKVE